MAALEVRKPAGSRPNAQVRSAPVPTSVVTGGAGFLGSHLCEYLLAQGDRVLCLDNLETASLENIEHIRDPAFMFVNHDVVEHIAIGEPVDFVYHLASPASPIDYLRLPLHTLKVGSYGKRYAEAMVMAYHRQQGVDTSIARIFNTYGPRMRPHDGRAIPTFVRQALESAPLTVFGDGSQTRSFCYVDDLIRGLHLLAQSGEHHPVNLGNPQEHTLLELAQVVLRVTGSSSEIVFAALPIDDPQVRQPDITRAQQLLSWEPEVVELEDGLRRMLGAMGRETVAV